MVQALPVEILLGIYLGILTGIFPALIAWGLGFIFKYFTGVSIPAFGVIVLSLAIAGINGGLLALNDPAVLASGPRVVIALVVVLMVSMYAHSKGDQMGATFPKRLSLSKLRERTLSSDVVDLVGSRGEVRVEVIGEVIDMEGYPPLSEETRTAIKTGEWRLPADLPISELETRFADRLKTELDLADVSVSIDERGRATVIAAPPLSGISKRVPTGKRAVSLDVLVPTGVARGDEVLVVADGLSVEGTVVAARSGTKKEELKTDGGTEEVTPPVNVPTTTGGDGRVTVAVARSDAEKLLSAQRPKIVVTARGTRREFELISLLRQAGKRFRKFTVKPTSSLAGSTLAGANVRDNHDVAVLAVKRPNGWLVAPRGATELSAGDELFVVGTREALNAFEGVVG
ncbi:TrkA C-terminal domain-containing protein [Natronomonas gomsonensis]|jgi:Trk K+ transport system NAD-binding subunit|uniref:TrkA C-terminal domain-containing protein n=1 Tax=Natronomonas gomsonensis TaxID=1046043 RepID=UPI0020CA530A|nr:TrkA C-terminal domain-containing protein [Natronomonas gomsonensis]MCY4730901.1 TrkA C-terminal domain-containing protein [Natronomonas gomsonensis]